jgi:putative transposase
MTIPYRGSTHGVTYFIFQSDRMARLFMDVLIHYQGLGKYHLHEFVIMPDHFHLLVSPTPPVTIEKAVQFVKGGFSYRAKKEQVFAGEIWQSSLYDRRVRDAEEYARFRHDIHMNPVRRGLVPVCEDFPYSSARLRLDEVPEWLKPALQECPECRARGPAPPSSLA